jgi:hypothetical protein
MHTYREFSQALINRLTIDYNCKIGLLNRHLKRADLVGGVTVGGDAVSPHDDGRHLLGQM